MKLTFKISHTEESAVHRKICYIEVDYEASKETIINDLFSFFDTALQVDKEDVESCTRFCCFYINDKKVSVINDFNLLLFIELNELDVTDIKVDYFLGGIGGADYVNDKMKIFFPSSEKNHKERPHIHISNCKGNNDVVFSLLDNSILAGKENWIKYFTRKEKKNVLKFLKTYRKELIEYYNTLSKGIVPEPVKYAFGDSKEIHYL